MHLTGKMTPQIRTIPAVRTAKARRLVASILIAAPDAQPLLVAALARAELAEPTPLARHLLGVAVEWAPAA